MTTTGDQDSTILQTCTSSIQWVHPAMVLTFALSAALLAQLLPTDQTLPPTIQFSATATAIAMNEALKVTRHLPASASSPLSRLLASKGSLEWENSVKAMQDIVPDAAPVGWRVLEKEDRLSTVEESKPRKAPGGLLSFWNRRASAIQAAPAETPIERSNSTPRSSLESTKSVPPPPSSRAPSPPKASTPSVPPPPPPDSSPMPVATTAVPSAVSRFLNRFSRAKGVQHSALVLSSDDLEFLSDIVPSASDPPDEDTNDSALGAFAGPSTSESPLPPKLPPLIPPPPKQPMPPCRSSSALADGAKVIGGTPTASQVQGANQIPNVPVLSLPLSPKPAVFFSHMLHPSPPEDVASPPIAFGLSSTLSTQQRFQSGSQPHPRTPSSLSIPPLLPPPPISPPQTPRPNVFSITTPGHSSALQNSDISSFSDPYEPDEEFTPFTSFPPSAPAPFPSLDSCPRRSPSPPSPPPRRTYERTHYPSSSSTSSILSPASQSSADQLYSTRSSISASLDGFDDLVSPPVVRRENRKRTPSPPPLPAKSQHRQPPRIHIFPRTPSQTFASPTPRTSLMTSASPVPSVSDTERQRAQALVDHAAARGGSLWPNSPTLDEPRVKPIPPPLSSFTSPKPVGEECFDLLGDGDILGGGRLEVLPPPVRSAGSIGVDSVSALHAPFGVAGGPRKGFGSSNQLQPSSPPLPSTSTPLLSFSSLGTSAPSATTNTGSVQAARPRQTGGLSAQDLSFFEGL